MFKTPRATPIVSNLSENTENDADPPVHRTDFGASYHTKTDHASRTGPHDHPVGIGSFEPRGTPSGPTNRPAARRHTSAARSTLIGALLRELLDRARHLDPADRALLRAIYEDGHTVTALATAQGRPIGSLARRVRTLRRRLTSPAVVATIRRLPSLPPDLRAVAIHTVIRGQSLNQTALALGQSFSKVRRLRDVILSMASFS